jgi:hypothetical protein
VIDSTGLKVFLVEGEWKVKKHGKERRQIWRSCILLLTATHVKLFVQTPPLNNVMTAAFPGLIRQTPQKNQGSHGRRGLTIPFSGSCHVM